jgi:hypothetical protein
MDSQLNITLFWEMVNSLDEWSCKRWRYDDWLGALGAAMGCQQG